MFYVMFSKVVNGGDSEVRKIVECVPNISEGRRKEVIDAIVNAAASVEGVKVLDVDPGWDTNRTVITFVGEPEAVLEAAYRLIAKAYELIDMRHHKGAHPRMGAVDVCPFVPVSGVTMEECVELAHRLGKKVGEELRLPVYLYEYAATRPERRNLADIRAGEYEALPEKLKDPNWKPDYGPAEFNPKFGAIAIGARNFLIAYNINLNTKDKKLANKIAKVLRERGYYKRTETGEKIHVPGKLKSCKAIGWYVDDYGIAQISMNLTNYKETPPHVAFEAADEEARKIGVRVTGSEIVGLVPKEAIIMAAKHFLRKQERSTALPERDLIFMAVRSLGLDEVAPFNPDEKIIEYAIGEEEKLLKMNVREFVDEVSRGSPAPGGGAVSALSGALAGALVSMVVNLSVGKKKFQDRYERLIQIGERAQELKDRMIALVEEDTAAFEKVMNAMRMPKSTDEEKQARAKAILEATKEATRVPLNLMELAVQVFDLAEEVSQIGNPNSISDAACAATQAMAATEGAYLNVLINCSGLEDEDFRKEALSRAEELLKLAREKHQAIFSSIRDKLLADVKV